MSDLQSCYFCGTPESVQEYAVVPPRFTPDGESPQSAVLCEQCKTKLLQVIKPLTEQLAAESERNAETAASSTSSDEPTRPDEPAVSGITMSSSDDTATVDATTDAAATDDAATDGTTTDGAATDNPVNSGDIGEPSSGETSTPPNYRRAMRMLSNREFPLDRSEVESMLAGAYDLERHEVADVLDHAIETGRLVEEGGQFHEP